LNEDNQPTGPLELVVDSIRQVGAFARSPFFITSTRRPQIDPATLLRIAFVNVKGLPPEHVAALVHNWHFFIYSDELEVEDSQKIAAKLFRHPVAARMTAGLLGTQSVEYF
jgi:hypothetical protein